MRFINQNKIIKELVNVSNLEMFFELFKKLDDENYASPFDESKDWHVLQPLVIKRTELSSDYAPLIC